MERPNSERRNMQIQPARADEMRKELPRLLDQFDEVDVKAVTSESPFMAPDPSQGFFDEPIPPLPQPEWIHTPAEIPGEVPPMSESITDWQPRQEVMAITEQKVTETLDNLPRTLREVRTDRPGAPDISLPGPRPEFDSFETSPVSFQALHSPSTDVGSDLFGFPTGGNTSLEDSPGVSPAQESSEMLIPEIEPPDEITSLDAVETLLRLETRVYDDPENPDFRYFKIQLLPNGMDAFPVVPRDVVYLVDCSASMTESKLRIAGEGINASLHSLSGSDRVHVIAFRDKVELLDAEGVQASVFGKAKVRTFLSTLHARGQTDVYASLHALQSLPSVPGRPMLALLITDGVPTQGLTDSSEIIEDFSKNNQGQISVFGLGGGGRVNRLLLDFLSFRNRGTSLVAPQAQGLKEVIVRLAEEVRRPVLTDLSYQFTGITEPQIYPETLSHLYLDRPLILIGRTLKSQPTVAFQIVGRSADGDHDMLFTLDLDNARQGDASLRQEWAWQALLAELSTSISDLNSTDQDEVQELLRTYDLVIPDAYRE